MTHTPTPWGIWSEEGETETGTRLFGPRIWVGRMSDPFASWRAALAGGKPPLHETEPWCGYFRARDQQATKMDGRKWPTVPCAIWRTGDGQLRAERGGALVPVDWIWPWCASKPITYEEYQSWYVDHKWPEAVKA